MMIHLAIVWLIVVAYTAHGRVITVSNAGVDNDECCGNGACPCSSLSHALYNQSSNVIINITSASVSLGSSAQVEAINNITITGKDNTIRCNNTGAIHFVFCNNIIIEGIIFDQCGLYSESSGGLDFYIVQDVTIKNCTFQNSRACAVTLDLANENIAIINNNFVSNDNQGDLNSQCSGLRILFGNHISIITLDGNNFYNNGYRESHLPHTEVLYSVVIDIYPSLPYPPNLHLVIHNTAFVNNARGLSVSDRACSAEIRMSNLHVYNNTERGIYVKIDGCQNYHHYLSISSSNFVNNGNPVHFLTSSKEFGATVEIFNSTFLLNTVGRVSQDSPVGGAFKIFSFVPKSKITIFNCTFLNNLDGALGIFVGPPRQASNCLLQNITLSNVLIYNTTTLGNRNNTDGTVYIETKDASTKVTFEEVQFELNSYTKQHGGVLVVKLDRGCGNSNQSLSEIKFDGCMFTENKAFLSIVTLRILNTDDDVKILHYVEIANTNFDDNFGGDYIVLFHSDIDTYRGGFKVSFSNFTNNIGVAIWCLALVHFELSETVWFVNNTADSGAAIYINANIDIILKNKSYVYFTNNSARLRGGAMYIDIPPNCINNGITFNMLPNDSYIFFVNNSANLAGNSIYFNILRTCNVITDNSTSSLLHIPSMFNYSQPSSNSYPIATTPLSIKFHSLTVIINRNYTDNNYYTIQSPKMLGEFVSFSASVFDYFNHSSEPAIFHMKCDTCDGDYVLSKDQISVSSNSLQEFQVFPRSSRDVDGSTNISIMFTSVLDTFYKQFGATLVVKLSSCQRGHYFNTSSVPPQCVCYPHRDIVRCNRDYSEINIGYWVGNVSLHFTSALCPNNYCSFAKREETSRGYFELPHKLDDQCSLHRTGVACSQCTSGYTLAYDSPVCINNDKCSAGITVLVVLLTIIYWVVVVTVVFGVMYFNNRVLSGYVYGIIYYYSIVDILLGSNLYISDENFEVISIISSFAKLTPQVFGQLCFVEGLSGIDQQFIQYIHAVAVSLITLIMIIAARYSLRIARYISRCIISVICVLILLSYTSLASTSLRLLRPLTFEDNNVDEVRTFLSPELRYFEKRHLAYSLIALSCEALLIGLPLLLLFEPLIRKKITLTRIKPLLDQFQGCFKDKYHWFAAYYLICRQVIILIVYVGNSNYYNMLFYLQTACIIIALVHFWYQPYKNALLNLLDGIFLLTLVLVVSLNIFSVSLSSSVEGLAMALVLLPLFIYLFVAVCKLIGRCITKGKLVQRYERKEADRLNLRNVNENKTDGAMYSVLQESLLDYSDN